MGIFDKKKIAYFVLEKVNEGKAVLLTTEWKWAKRQRIHNFELIARFNKSKFKYKEIVPVDSVYYEKAKQFLIII